MKGGVIRILPVTGKRAWDLMAIGFLAFAALFSIAPISLPGSANAQSLEPRAYANTPVGLNFLILVYAYQQGDVLFDPSVPLKDASVEIHYSVLGYARPLDVWGKSGKIDIIIPYAWLSGKAKVEEEQRSRRVSGFADPALRFSVNLYGASSLSLEEFKSYRQNTILGVSLQVTMPLGQYDSDRLVNIGTNRWSFKPEVGISQALGRWTLESSAGVTFYTNNNDFFGGKAREQDPIYSLQGHLIYNFPRGIWAALTATYYAGGHTTIGGVEGNDLQKNWRFGATLALPLSLHHSIKLYASTGVYTRTGDDFNLVGVAWQYRWGGRPLKMNVPMAFHIMAKPSGSACNLQCEYCFFLKKERLYPGSRFRMPDEVHEAYIRQLFEAHQVPRVTVAWQGGEPTLMGLDFFRRSLEFQRKYRRPGTRIENTFQTNGILLNGEWCRFFHENSFLIGLSLDGPRELHDIYRKDKGGRGTFDRALKAARLLQEHEVEFNILCTVHRKNADHPLKVYRFFRDELGAKYLQFIPIVERDNESGFQEGNRVTDRSVRPDQWGRFLIKIFEEWVRRDVGRTFVQNIDGALAGWLGRAGTVCILGPTCGQGMALEHNGDLYSCDHFVEPNYYLGNILQTPLIDLVASAKQRKFGQDKKDTLPRYCRQCEVRSICNGECPKNRFLETPEGEPGLNYLCAGYKAFFEHADKPMRIMADLIRRSQPAEKVMGILEKEKENFKARFEKAGRNDPCPCGSGLKFKRCHGK